MAINVEKNEKTMLFVNKLFRIVDKYHILENFTRFLAVILFRLIFVHYIKDNSIFEH